MLLESGKGKMLVRDQIESSLKSKDHAIRVAPRIVAHLRILRSIRSWPLSTASTGLFFPRCFPFDRWQSAAFYATLLERLGKTFFFNDLCCQFAYTSSKRSSCSFCNGYRVHL